MKMTDDTKKNINLYFRGFIVKRRNNESLLDSLTIKIRKINLALNPDLTVYRGVLKCDIPPSNNVKKIKYSVTPEDKPYDFEYPIYFFNFNCKNEGFTFCCLPNIKITPHLFKDIENFSFFRFNLMKICANFYQMENPPEIKLSRLNGKLNYDDESVSSISLCGKNNLQSQVIRKFLKLYPKSNEEEKNPFYEELPLLEPKSSKISCQGESVFCLNVDSSGNFSFILSSINQFVLLDQILKFSMDSEAFEKASTIPLKKSILSLEKIEN
jgi:hypothetical protein